MDRNIYRVMYFKPDGLWHVRHGRISVARDQSREAAVLIGTELASRHQPSQLLVHKLDGDFENEFTFGETEDPLPPRS